MFFLGLHLRQVFFSLAHRVYNVFVVLGSAGLFFVSEYVVRYLNTTVFAEWTSTTAAVTVGVYLIRSLAALPFGILVATWLSHMPVVGTFVIFVGKNTLPIYVSHQTALFFFMDERFDLIERHPDLFGFLETPLGGTWFGIVICVLTGFVFYWVGKTPVLKWSLFPPPLRPRR